MQSRLKLQARVRLLARQPELTPVIREELRAALTKLDLLDKKRELDAKVVRLRAAASRLPTDTRKNRLVWKLLVDLHNEAVAELHELDAALGK